MIQVHEAVEGDCERVLPLFEGFQNPRITERQWRSLFHYSWPVETDRRGFILTDDDRPVGFFGTIWSERSVRGKRERICNLSSWITLPEYRNQSLLLLKSVLALRDCTITCHSPAPQLYPLYKRFGFQDLETKLRILEPRPAWQSLSDWFAFRSATDPAVISRIVDESDRAILEAHRLHRCGHLLVHRGDDYCYLVYTRTKGKRYHFARLHYISRPEVFLRNLDRIRLRLLAAACTPLVMIDARLAADWSIPHSREASLGVRSVYRSETLDAREIDSLYSELILLGL